jgi:glucokinase
MGLFGGKTASGIVGGVDLGGTKIATAVVSPSNEILGSAKRPTPTEGGPEDVTAAIAGAMQEAADAAGVSVGQLDGIGIGAPGNADRNTGVLSGAGNLPGWSGNFPLGPELSRALGPEVVVGNDVQVGTMAEYTLGAGRGFDSLLGVFWGTGVGGGLILHGRPWLGRGRAGEIGHTLVRRGGAKAPNGLRGTVEAYAGRKAMEAKARREAKRGRETILFDLMKKRGKDSLTSSIWFRAWKKDDELACELLDRGSKALSAGIASAVNLLDVEAVVVGGGLGVRFGDTLVPKILEGTGRYLLEPEQPPKMLVAGLGDEGGVLGASMLVR